MNIRKGQKIIWVGRFTKKKFDCIISNPKTKGGCILIKPDPTGENPLPYHHYYIDIEEIILKP